ncbi:MAG: fibronectin type III domain-containing protein [Verrucomicrobiaceae bacterium]|nr:fibronectin type III domain-containing protein [Verrucomicrobiaceae bacterium]
MPLRFDSPGQRYDSSPALRYDSAGPVPAVTLVRNRTMTRFKLELKQKTVAEKIALGANHITSMTGNAAYPQPTRVPTDAQFQAAQDDLVAADAAADVAETVWKQKVQDRKAKEEAWDTVCTARANNCEAVTPNDLVALASTGFPLRTAPEPVGTLPAPGDLRATSSDMEGQIDLRCNAVKGASSYEWECRLHDGNPPWSSLKTSTTVRISATGLTPGLVYAFRVRAIGSAGPGAWSDEATERAP